MNYHCIRIRASKLNMGTACDRCEEHACMVKHSARTRGDYAGLRRELLVTHPKANLGIDQRDCVSLGQISSAARWAARARHQTGNPVCLAGYGNLRALGCQDEGGDVYLDGAL